MTRTKLQDQPPRPWDRFISDLDREVYSKCGFGAPVGLGQRPALLIIDAQYRTTGENSDPILEAMKECATAVGEEAWKAVGHIERLLARFRAAGWPVMYAQGERTGLQEGGRYTDKIPALGEAYNLPGSRGAEIVEPLAVRARSTLTGLGYTDIHFRVGDGYVGWPEAAPFDAIIVTAAPDHVPAPLLAQLAPGGRMVIPVGQDRQSLTLISRDDDGVTRRNLLPVLFVPMTGEAERR